MSSKVPVVDKDVIEILRADRTNDLIDVLDGIAEKTAIEAAFIGNKSIASVLSGGLSAGKNRRAPGADVRGDELGQKHTASVVAAAYLGDLVLNQRTKRLERPVTDYVRLVTFHAHVITHLVLVAIVPVRNVVSSVVRRRNLISQGLPSNDRSIDLTKP